MMTDMTFDDINGYEEMFSEIKHDIDMGYMYFNTQPNTVFLSAISPFYYFLIKNQIVYTELTLFSVKNRHRKIITIKLYHGADAIFTSIDIKTRLDGMRNIWRNYIKHGFKRCKSVSLNIINNKLEVKILQ